jgi:uncharacterized protein (DUF2384 family)
MDDNTDKQPIDGRDVLVRQVETLLHESGNTEPFDADAWVKRWLDSPNHALDNAKPAAYLSTPEGLKLLSNIIGAMQVGSYM